MALGTITFSAATYTPGGAGPHRAIVEVCRWAGMLPTEGAVSEFYEITTGVDLSIDLPETDGTFCYRFVISTPATLGEEVRYTTVPAPGPTVFADLPDVDPTLFAEIDPTPSLITTIRQEAASQISAEKGAAGGVAELDEDSLVPLAQVPVDAILADPRSIATFVAVEGEPSDGDAIVWDETGGQWVPAAVEGGGTALTVLSEAEGNTGTATTARAISAARLVQQIQEHAPAGGGTIAAIIVETGTEARLDVDVVVWIDPDDLGAANALATDPILPGPAADPAVPDGGTTGQALVKASDDNGDVEWGTVGGGGGGYLGPAPRAGEYLFNAVIGGNRVESGGATMPSGKLYCVPYYNTGPAFDIDRIAMNVATAGAGGAVIRLGAFTVVDGRIGELLFDAGTVDASSTGDKHTTISESMPTGVTLLVMVSNDSTVAPRWIGYGQRENPLWWRGAGGPVEIRGSHITYTGYSTASLPSTGTTSGEAIPEGSGDSRADCPVIAVRAA